MVDFERQRKIGDVVAARWRARTPDNDDVGTEPSRRRALPFKVPLDAKVSDISAGETLRFGPHSLRWPWQKS